MSGNQFAEHDAEGVDIGGGGDRSALELFGRGIGRGQHDARVLRSIFVAVGGKQLGDAEVEQFHLALGSHHDVRGLEVAVHDEGAMGGVYGPADLDEQGQSLAQSEPSAARVFDDRGPFDQFEGNEGQAFGRDVAFDQACDAGVLEPGQGAPFVPKATLFGVAVEAATEQFEGHLLAHAGLFAFGSEHDRGAAVAEAFEQTERANRGPDRWRLQRGFLERPEHGFERAIKQLAAATVDLEHAPEVRAAARIVAMAIDEGAAFGSGQGQRLLEQLAQTGLVLVHADSREAGGYARITINARDSGHQSSAACRNARAKRQSRSTVRRVSCRIVATCAGGRPAK